jgi:sugar phosphate permease
LTLLGLLCALTFVLYIDRVCIAQAVEPIQQELKLSNTQVSYVLMAFTLAYGLFEVPTGRWADRVGSRLVLTRIALWWSVFTALTAASTGFYSLLLVRFLFGAGEAGAYPNAARIVSRWYPAAERGRVQGLIQTAALVGGTVAPVAAAFLIRAQGWRGAFVFFAALGVVWAAVFWVWFRDDPARHPAVNASELALLGERPAEAKEHGAIPWRLVLTNRSVWTLGLIMVFGAFNSYLYYSWFPKYLQEARELDSVEAGSLASLVLGGAAVGTLSGGFLDDWLRRSGARHGRRWLGAIAYSLAAGLIGMGLLFESPRALAVCACLSCLAATCPLSAWWSCAIEISGRHLGALFGLMNGMGVFGAMGSQFFFGAFADWRKGQGYSGREQWDPAFAVYVVVLFGAALCWAFYSSHPVEPDYQKIRRGGHAACNP